MNVGDCPECKHPLVTTVTGGNIKCVYCGAFWLREQDEVQFGVPLRADGCSCDPPCHEVHIGKDCFGNLLSREG